MSDHQEVTYTLDFGVRGRRGLENQATRRPAMVSPDRTRIGSGDALSRKRTDNQCK